MRKRDKPAICSPNNEVVSWFAPYTLIKSSVLFWKNNSNNKNNNMFTSSVKYSLLSIFLLWGVCDHVHDARTRSHDDKCNDSRCNIMVSLQVVVDVYTVAYGRVGRPYYSSCKNRYAFYNLIIESQQVIHYLIAST